jgi:hypothetical protein
MRTINELEKATVQLARSREHQMPEVTIAYDGLRPNNELRDYLELETMIH